MGNIAKFLSYINPIFFYYVIIYSATKFVIEPLLSVENVWQSLWHKIMDIFGDNEAVYVTWVLNIYTFLLYWTLGGILLYIELVKRPKTLLKYKIQKTTSEIEKNNNIYKAIIVVLKNQLVALLISIFIYSIADNFLCIKVTRDAPNFSIVMRDMIVCFFCQEFFFYYSHRALHYKWFYKLHKQHHEYITPVCITAEYCGTIEHIFSNIIPVVIGFKFVGAHVTTAALWLTIVIITTLNDHCGYHLPFLHSSELHDYHHLKFNVNFSVYGFLDKLHGTYGHFEKSKSFENHRTIFSFTPASK